MLSGDRSLFEQGGIGDAVRRHQYYADLAGELDVVVFASSEYKDSVIGENLSVFSTKSTKLSHWPRAVVKAQELAQKKNYDLIVCQDIASPSGIALKSKIGAPLLIGLHSMFFDTRLMGFKIDQWYLSRKIKKSLKDADAFRVNNISIESKLRSWGLKQNILVQPTPVDVGPFIVEKKERHSLPHILYVGRLSVEKNVEMLGRALLNLNSDFKATIVGDGPERLKLETLAKKDSRIIFAGAQSYKALPAYYKEADIFVLPSKSESFGKVLIEAGAAQCAIVATRTAGAESILTNEKDSILTPVGDEKALQMALESLCADMDRQKALGKQALETARQYSFEEGCERIVQFWKKIAEK